MAEMHDMPTGAPGAQQTVRPPTGGGGNGNLTNHRLDKLEERMTSVETSLKALEVLCGRIDEKLEAKASKTYVLTVMVSTVVISVLTLIGHIVLRAI